jgi:hypothetical protein
MKQEVLVARMIFPDVLETLEQYFDVDMNCDGHLLTRDVFDGEPNVHPDLLQVPNVVLTPHMASAIETTRRAVVARAADHLIAALGCGPQADHPLTPINPDVLGAMHAC